MVGTQVCSVEHTHIMGRDATALPYVMGEKVEVHPSKGRGQSDEMLGSGQTEMEKILEIMVAPSSKARRGQMTGSRTHRDQTTIRTRVS